MKKITIYLFLAFSLAGTTLVYSQKVNNTNNDFVEMHLAKIKADVQLTAAQEAAIRGALEQYRQARQTSAQLSTKNSKLEGYKQNYQTFTAVCESVLNEEQLLVLRQKAEERKEQGVIRPQANEQNNELTNQ
jgi:predicted enzyme involved in methoxymalonyl-ACP biosynthesis